MDFTAWNKGMKLKVDSIEVFFGAGEQSISLLLLLFDVCFNYLDYICC